MKRTLIVRILTILPFVMLGAAMVWFLLSYAGLPDRIGVHFGPDGEFDVYSEKVFGFYPFAAGFGLMIVFLLLGHFVGKIKKTGMKVTEKGDALFRTAVKIYALVLIWVWALFFTRWTYSVVTQTPNDLTFLRIISAAFILSVPAMVILMVGIRIRYRIKKTGN